QLTHGGGCVYAPAFLDDNTIVYDLTRDGTDSIHRIDRAGGEPVRLTDDAGTSQWRANPGAPGEVVYVVSDWDGTGSHLAARSLAHPETERVIAPVTASSVAYAGGAYYYTDSDR